TFFSSHALTVSGPDRSAIRTRWARWAVSARSARSSAHDSRTARQTRSWEGKGEGKGVITDIDRLRGEGASGTCMHTLDAVGLGVKKALFSDDPFPLPSDDPFPLPLFSDDPFPLPCGLPTPFPHRLSQRDQTGPPRTIGSPVQNGPRWTHQDIQIGFIGWRRRPPRYWAARSWGRLLPSPGG